MARSAANEPWSRRKGETDKVYRAFLAYRDMGTARSQDDLSPQIGLSARYIAELSSRWQWIDRCRAWDDHIAAVEHAAAEKEAARRAKERERRRQESRDKSYEMAQAARLRIAKMIRAPLVEKATKTSEDGKTTIHVTKPARWNWGNVAQVMKAILELEKYATGDDSAADDGFDPLTATPEECREYLESKGIQA